MPFCGIERPQIGVSTLKAHLQNERIPCDIAYLNLRFADAAGYELYDWITNNYSYEVFAGEWIFARQLFADDEIHYEGYLDEILRNHGAFPPNIIQRIHRMAMLAGPFLDNCMQQIDWDRYSVIGFTSTFEQNLASLALAKRIKERFPNKIIAMGGGNTAGQMGLQIHQSFPFVDYVFTGEADLSFPELVLRILNRDSRRDDIKGYVRREQSASIDTGSAPLIHNLDSLPYPNYDDFFKQFYESRVSKTLSPTLQIETARGCWWGAKSHCTFCGLNRDEMTFRVKSSDRAMDEMLHLHRRYGPQFISAVDNIISMGYFKTLLPELKRRQLGIRLFYETKANLKREQVKLLYDSGITMIQPGIEAFSSNVLKLMRKGVSPIHNAQLLKWCLEYGVNVRWNLLFGFPGENSKDYKETLDFLQAMTHLPPPDGYGALRLDRFSPYFDYPERFGIRKLRALKPYRYLYPFEDSVLFNLAYFFEYDFDGKEKRDRWFEPVRQHVDQWKEIHGTARLEISLATTSEIVVQDTRPNRIFSEYRFRNPEKSIIEFCDTARTFKEITQFVHSNSNGSSPTEDFMRNFLNYLIRHRLMLREGERYLSLILSQRPKIETNGDTRRIQLDRSLRSESHRDAMA
jgi:ribosomal peptide maturation radical SAM protein 1